MEQCGSRAVAVGSSDASAIQRGQDGLRAGLPQNWYKLPANETCRLSNEVCVVVSSVRRDSYLLSRKVSCERTIYEKRVRTAFRCG